MTPAEFKQARIALGLNQSEFAAWLGYAANTHISVMERGLRKVPETTSILVRAYLSGWRA